jgi:CheY-like chemotaxis protein
MMLPAQVPQVSKPSNARMVLVAEDEILVRVMVSDYLRDHGYEVVEAADAAEAPAVFEAGAPVDIVFSDVQMPGSMDGAMLADVVRLRYRIPVLLTTGDYARAAAVSLADTVALLPKPYALDDVVRHLEALLAPVGARARR